MDRRLQEWTEDTGRILPSQSGFCEHHRVQNASYILRAMAEKAFSLGRHLTVEVLDLKDAFLSVDQPSLWAKLARWDPVGPLLDWLRMLYSQLSCVVRFNGEVSEKELEALVGILTGDLASPSFGSGSSQTSLLRCTVHPDDVILAGQRGSHQWAADDLKTACMSSEGVQQKVSGCTVDGAPAAGTTGAGLPATGADGARTA